METNNFSEPWNDSDTILVVEGEHLYVHKAILCMCSPVFKTMLSSTNFKEGTSMEIALPGKKNEHIKEMLRNMYPFPSNMTGIFYWTLFVVFVEMIHESMFYQPRRQ